MSALQDLVHYARQLNPAVVSVLTVLHRRAPLANMLDVVVKGLCPTGRIEEPTSLHIGFFPHVGRAAEGGAVGTGQFLLPGTPVSSGTPAS